MKQELIGFISAEFGTAFWFLPLDVALMADSGGVGQCQVLSTSGLQQPFQSYNRFTACGWCLQALLLPGWAKLLCKAGFYHHWVQGYVSNHPMSPQDLPLSVPVCLPAVILRLVPDLTISERASGRNRGLWFLNLPLQVLFRLQGR